LPRIIDITPPVDRSIAVWPGDTPYSVSWVARMDKGASCNVSSITTTPHVGAHADGPLHFLVDGPPIGDVDLEPYLGRCRVLDVTGAAAVTEESVFGMDLTSATRLLFKTGTFPDPLSWNPDFAYLDPAFVRRLGKMGVRLVGIDTPSVDPMDSKTLPAHHALVEMGMRNLEGLDLSRVTPGDYELIALPLRLADADSSPVRAVLRTLD